MHVTSCDMEGPDSLSLSSEQTWQQTTSEYDKRFNVCSSAATKENELN